MNDADRERYAEQAKRQEEKRLAEHQSRVEKMDYIERLIIPLTFKPLKEDASEHAQLNRQIMSGDESVGSIAWELSGYSYQHKSRYRLRSPRIPSRSRYGMRHGHRDYKNIDSVILNIAKFCMPVTDDENRAEVLRIELRHYRDVLQKAHTRHLHIEGTGYASPNVDGFIRLLASDIMQDKLEGQEFIRILVRKKRVHNRFHAWVMEHFITPRQDELNALDTSQETVR
jgi:hypothetical protein